MSLSAYIRAARPRTLPLVAAAVMAGLAATAAHHTIDWPLAALTLAVGLLLQVLANYANDYGDARSGVDSRARVGEARLVSSGELSPTQMRRALIATALLALAAGCALLLLAQRNVGWGGLAILLALGLAALAAAITYTCGPRPYGYHALGDLAVLLFFGLFAVVATQTLQTGRPLASSWLIAMAIGLDAVALLNCNNLRDMPTDREAGKVSVALRLGERGARRYQVLLVALAFAFAAAWVVAAAKPWAYLALPAHIPLATHARRVGKGCSRSDLDREMPIIGRATLAYATLTLLAALC